MTGLDQSHSQRVGLALALGVFLSWGLFPSYFKLLAEVPAIEVMSHRIVWSALFMAVLLPLGGGIAAFRQALRDPRVVGLIGLSALLIGINWLTYVSTIAAGHVLEASLGYFLSPLTNVALGRLVLGERLTRLQLAACLLALSAVAALAFGTEGEIWRALVLAISFGLYGLVRKTVRVEALPGNTLECFLLVPFAGLYLAWCATSGTNHFGGTMPGLSILLALSGVITAVPLIAYAAAARRLKLSTLGLMQFVTPTMAFLLGVLVYGEPFGRAKLVCFIVIWAALTLYARETIRLARRPA
ncbi:MAG TPA: EamA family transporter RarD [Aliidongia sp.]|uniref:EamA family transporter RarD n=1 Tax=Aliidongia sp. TaxID=1914230 RepID=UPI002DDCA6E2|nr:EamA family transporter RarD [Aliidongia sp.]HEV2674817.1 EamA family transporter RarD [Aliidongia sp.]